MQVTVESILLHQSRAFHIRHPWSRPWDGFIRYLYVNYQVRICEFVPGICMYICVHCLCSLFLFWRLFLLCLWQKNGEMLGKNPDRGVCVHVEYVHWLIVCVCLCVRRSLSFSFSLSLSLSLCALSLSVHVHTIWLIVLVCVCVRVSLPLSLSLSHSLALSLPFSLCVSVYALIRGFSRCPLYFF